MQGLWEEVVSKHSLAGRALRVAAASGIVLGVLAPTGRVRRGLPAGGDRDAGRPGLQVRRTRTSNSSTLPFTGSDVAGLAAIGAGAALAGVVMVRHSKKKPAPPPERVDRQATD